MECVRIVLEALVLGLAEVMSARKASLISVACGAKQDITPSRRYGKPALRRAAGLSLSSISAR